MLEHLLGARSLRRIEIEHGREKVAQLLRVFFTHVVLLHQHPFARPKLERADVSKFTITVEELFAVFAR